jgi:hypothetical protein
MSDYTYKPTGVSIGRIEVFEPKPNIVFQMGHANTEIMRLTKDGVWVNPDIKPEEAAQTVLSALDAQIKHMVKKAVEEERKREPMTLNQIREQYATAPVLDQLETEITLSDFAMLTRYFEDLLGKS